MELTDKGIREVIKHLEKEMLKEPVYEWPKKVIVPPPLCYPNEFMCMAKMLGYTQRQAIRWAKKNGTRIYKEGAVFRAELL